MIAAKGDEIYFFNLLSKEKNIVCFDIKMEQLFLENGFSLVLDLFSDFSSWILTAKKLAEI